MSAEIDPAKLKVVELRAELSSRGLDTKGNKPVLVKRLKDALEKELEKELPDTSIADTSTEDFNSSQTDETITPTPEESKIEEETSPPVDEDDTNKKTPEKLKDGGTESCIKVVTEEESSEPPEKKVEKQQEQEVAPVVKKPKLDAPSEESGNSEIVEHQSKNVIAEEGKNVDKSDENTQLEEEKMQISEENQQTQEEQISDNSQCLAEGETKKIDSDDVLKSSVEDAEKQTEAIDEHSQVSESSEKVDDSKANDTQQKGDKRKRSPSPAKRRRSKSPPKEDEPVIDNNKVQLNWYDSDLHMQIDKNSFLSGKPYHDGAFGYVWSGVRATHGANIGKVCYEVKITEELKWEDFIRQPDKGRRDRDRKDSRRSEKGDKSEKKNADDKSAKKESSDHKQDSQNEIKEDDKSNGNIETSEISDKDPTPEDKIEEKGGEEDASQHATTEDHAESKTEESTGEETQQSNVPETEVKSEERMDVDDTTSIKTENVEDKNDADSTSTEKTNKGEKVESDEKELVPIPTHLIRIGWSSLSSGLQLGESKFSYGFESSGNFVHENNFSEYGKSFTVGDVIGAYVEFTEDSIDIKYSINGEELPIAISIPKSEVPEENFSLFPHVLSRNLSFEVNLGGREEPLFTNPESLSDYIFIDKFEEKVLGPTRPESRSDCEVIMMCGLPGSGKTHWVKEHVANNPDKRYTVIGNAQLLEKMTVKGNPLKSSMKGRWNVVLDKLGKCLNKLVEVAALRRRNYVIDQTNVFPSAQRRKMRSFEGFKRRAVVVVCADEEQARRRALQEAQDGKDVPNIAVYEMKANMSLPKVSDWLEEVTYVELDEPESKTMVQKYNKEGRDNGFGPVTPRRDYRDDRKWHPYRKNDRGGYRDRNYTQGRFERGHSGWSGRSGSYGRDDRRDNRGWSNNRPRDWRNNNRGSSSRDQDGGRDRNNRQNRDGYSRNRSQASNRNQAWQSGGSWGQSGNWQGQGGGSGSGSGSGSGNWNQGYAGQSKWNYTGQGGYGQQSYGNYPNWNYYGQYQNWSGQGWGQSSQSYSQNPGNQTTPHK